MEYKDEIFDTYETYLKQHQLAVEKLMDLENVPRFIRLMEMKAIIRKVQKFTIEIEGTAQFLDRTHQPSHDPI